MHIRAYLKKHGLSQEQFGKRLGVSQQLVCQWLDGTTRVTAERAKAIEAKTRGEIGSHELRPDLFSKARAA